MIAFAHEMLTDNRATILDDPFIRSYIDDVLRSLRTQYLIDLLKPYTRLEISFLARVSIQRSGRMDHFGN
jgi:COP9 signalosome complex subunit 2